MGLRNPRRVPQTTPRSWAQIPLTHNSLFRIFISLRSKFFPIPESEVWEVERLRTIGKQPAIYSLNYFPASIVPVGKEDEKKKFTHSLYKFLSEVCGQIPVKGQCILKPMVGEDHLSAIMKVPRKTLLIYMESVDFNQNQQPIICAREYSLAELFEFWVERQNYDSEI